MTSHKTHEKQPPVLSLQSTSPVIEEVETKAPETIQPLQVPTVNAELYKPALDLAYPLAVESYKEAERRLDVVEKRLQELLAFAVTLTLGIVALCAGKVDLRDSLVSGKYL